MTTGKSWERMIRDEVRNISVLCLQEEDQGFIAMEKLVGCLVSPSEVLRHSDLDLNQRRQALDCQAMDAGLALRISSHEVK